MKFNKTVPTIWGYYWVVDISYPDPCLAYFWKDIQYPFQNHMFLLTHRAEIAWIGEHEWYRFGDKIEKPDTSEIGTQK